MGLHGVFAKLTDPAIRGKSDENILVHKGRIWILIVIYSHLYSLFYNQTSPIATDFGLLKRQCSVLRQSALTHAQIDACLACHAELFGMLASAQSDMQNIQGHPDAWKPVERHLKDLETWWAYWSSIGDHSPFTTKDIGWVFFLHLHKP